MNENIFDKRRLKTFSNCKDLVRSMVGTKDGVIVYNERFRLDLENTCYRASICDDLQEQIKQLQQELTDYKERNKKAIEYIKWFKKDNEEFYKNKGIGLTLPEVDGLLKILDKKEGN